MENLPKLNRRATIHVCMKKPRLLKAGASFSAGNGILELGAENEVCGLLCLRCGLHDDCVLTIRQLNVDENEFLPVCPRA
jgi:hypothetical protein